MLAGSQEGLGDPGVETRTARMIGLGTPLGSQDNSHVQQI